MVDAQTFSDYITFLCILVEAFFFPHAFLLL